MTEYMDELDAFSYREKIAAGAPVLIPAGSIEQHGRHMPLNVDVLLSRAMAGRTAKQIGAIVAPPIVYGYKSQQRSGGGNHLTGTTSLDAETVIAIAKALVLEFARHGAGKIGIINGHFENYQFLYEGVDLALRELRHGGTEDVTVMLLSYWDFVDDRTIDELYPDGFTGWDLEHGGVLETSLMLHLFPERVDMTQVDDVPPAELPNYDVLPVRPELTPASGCLSSGANASAEKGKLLLDRATSAMAGAIAAEFDLTDSGT
ncbi:creatininase [Spelaeicoccus albus]|uniref:Creatinine amidohydrolase n=1 Tax=Spelaeicoccus albus TaxID=1280376 RepID=A0A7Z0D0C3_9MICO|nr:creatininase [Spelaeicoccus albus]NYI67179.1 creatinine amidohydrolase [Spelaeicoccus albus]